MGEPLAGSSDSEFFARFLWRAARAPFVSLRSNRLDTCKPREGVDVQLDEVVHRADVYRDRLEVAVLQVPVMSKRPVSETKYFFLCTPQRFSTHSVDMLFGSRLVCMLERSRLMSALLTTTAKAAEDDVSGCDLFFTHHHQTHTTPRTVPTAPRRPRTRCHRTRWSSPIPSARSCCRNP